MFKLFRLRDEQVIRRVREGRREDFGVIVRRYLGAIHAFACAHVGNPADADDIVQETFLRAYESLDSLRDTAKLGPWLFAIARNACRNHHRAAIRREVREHAAMPAEFAVQPDPARREAQEVLREKVAQLAEDAREVLLLHYFAGKRVAEIADLLGISPDAAKKRLQRAREALGELVARELTPAYQSARPESERTKAVMGLIAASPAPWALSGTATAATTAASLSLGKGAMVVAVVAIAGGGVVAFRSAQQWYSNTMQSTLQSMALPAAPAPTAVPARAIAVSDTAPLPATHATASGQTSGKTPAPASGAGATVRGVLRTDSGQVPRGATARLEKRVPEEGESFALTVEADSDGRAVFIGVPMDFYYLRATAPGYFGAAELVIEDKPFSEVPVTLRKARPMRGVVRDKDGRPIPKAVLTTDFHKPTAQSGEIHVHGPEAQTATTDSRGAFAFDHVWEGYWKFRVEAPDYATGFTDYARAGTTDTKIVLARMGSLAGRVVEAGNGKPVAGVSVGMSGTVPVLSTEDGSFRLHPKNLGNLDIQIEDDRYTLEAPVLRATIHEGVETSGVEVRVVPAAAISGRMRQADGEEGYLGYASLEVQPPGATRTEHLDLRLEDDGRYRIAGLRPGTYTIKDLSCGNLRPPGGTLPLSFELSAGQEVSEVDFVLGKDGPKVSGRVVDASGHDVKGAEVDASVEAGGMVYGTGGGVRDDGGFTIALRAPGRLHLYARKDDAASDPVGPLDLTEAGLAGVDLVLRPGAAIAGRVLEPAGTPVANVDVSIRQDGKPFGYEVERTDLDGTFEFRGLIPGEYEVEAKPLGAEPASATVKAVRGARHELVLKTGGDSVSIAGRITDEAGEPVVDAYINVEPDPRPGGSPQSDLEGRYTIIGLPPGDYRVEVRHGRYVSATRAGVTAGAKNVDFVLQRRGAIEGRVALSGAADPALGAEVQVVYGEPTPERLAALNPSMYSAVRPDGTFRIDDVEPGLRGVAARAPGFTPELATVEVAGGKTTKGVVISLQRGAVIEGLVTDAAGQPVAETAVFFNALPHHVDSDHGRTSGAAATSGTDGRFHIDSVPPGMTTLAIYHPDYAPRLVPAPKGVPAHVTLTEGSTLSGIVRLHGSPLPDARLSLSFSDWNLVRSAEADEQGAFSFTKLPPGELHLTLYPSSREGGAGPSAVDRTVSIPEEGPVSADFNIASGTAAVEGIVTLPPGATQSVAVCLLQTSEGRAAWQAVIGPDGSYRFPGLPGGTASIAVAYGTKTSRRCKNAEVALGEGSVVRRDFDCAVPGTAIVGRATPASGDQGLIFVVSGKHSLENLMNSKDPFADLRQSAVELVRDDGTFRVDGLDAGTYTVLAGTRQAVVVEVPDSGEVEISF